MISPSLAFTSIGNQCCDNINETQSTCCKIIDCFLPLQIAIVHCWMINNSLILHSIVDRINYIINVYE